MRNCIVLIAFAGLSALAGETVVQDFVEKNGVLVPRVRIINEGNGGAKAPLPPQNGDNTANKQVPPDGTNPPPASDAANKTEESGLNGRDSAVRAEREQVFKEISDSQRQQKAADLKKIGIEADWQKHSYAEMSDWERRALKGKDLNAAGAKINWRDYNWAELQDIERRVLKAKDLQMLGEDVSWRDTKYNDMLDRERRIKAANRLKEAGADVDWRKMLLTDLQEMELRVNKARDLKKLGVTVDWQKYSLGQLNEMERNEKSKK